MRSSRSGQPKPEDYQIVLEWSDEDACYIATLPAWQNVRTHGSTIAAATKSAYEVLAMLIANAIERREPLPHVQRAFSGKLNLRLPQSLHARLAREAEREGVSLNQLIVAKLAS